MNQPEKTAAEIPPAPGAPILQVTAVERLPKPVAKSGRSYIWAGGVLMLALVATLLLLPRAEDLPPQITARGEILKIEQELSALAFPPGAVDGIADAETAAAIRDFQRAAGLPEDGRATPELLEELGALRRGE